jgi:CobQ/CobB/MinD/ParA nucleotide binding domain
LQTITFYSYKGGLGRTLAVANAAWYLARRGHRVLALDFDFDGPGLHYKLALDQQIRPDIPDRGAVDYIHAFAVEGRIPGSLTGFVGSLTWGPGSGPDLEIMPAGAALSARYWRRLAQINWHDLFYSPGAQGVPFFLDLKEKLAQRPLDYLLIDSRTGISEIGGVATTLLADRVVCLLRRHPENLEGARKVLRSIKGAGRLARRLDNAAIEILPVLSRFPDRGDPEAEKRAASSVLDSLNERSEDVAMTLDLSEVYLLHSDPDLEETEFLLMGSDEHAQRPLYLDYARLFERLEEPLETPR